MLARAIHIRDTPPNYKSNPNYVYVGRGSKWGNPFTHKDGTTAQYKVASRHDACLAHAEWFMKQEHLLRDLHELQGKVLVCFCKPEQCHADFLADLVNFLYGVEA